MRRRASVTDDSAERMLAGTPVLDVCDRRPRPTAANGFATLRRPTFAVRLDRERTGIQRITT